MLQVGHQKALTDPVAEYHHVVHMAMFQLKDKIEYCSVNGLIEKETNCLQLMGKVEYLYSAKRKEVHGLS